MKPEDERLAIARLKAAGIPDPTREMRLLIRSGAGGDALEDLITRRITREPLSHLLGYRDFYNHRFIVTGDVLDPRPDTETLVAAALELPFTRVLDLGTGSGCILLSLLAERRDAVGCGTDISQKALDVAGRNRAALSLDDRATLAQSDWFANVSGQFDLIVSNPPYIAADEMVALQPEVRDYEPRGALTDEADGLTCYRRIAAGYAPHLAPGGHLMVEIGPTQAAAVSAIFESAALTAIRVIPDLDGRDRVISGRKPD